MIFLIIECFSCEYGLAPAEDESKNSVCKECSELIPNCYECFKNSNLDIIRKYIFIYM